MVLDNSTSLLLVEKLVVDGAAGVLLELLMSKTLHYEMYLIMWVNLLSAYSAKVLST